MRTNKAKNLQRCSIEDLEVELVRRRNATPVPVTSPDFSRLRDAIVRGVTMTIDSGYEHSNFKDVVYEVAVEVVYGKDFWAWREEQNFGVGTIFNHTAEKKIR